MKQRQLGRYGPLVGEIGLGCMGMSAFYGATKPEAESIEVLNRALDLGCNLLDTADVYGENEELLANLLATRRSEIILCSKFSFKITDSDAAFFDTTESRVCGKSAYVGYAIERSLKRLGVDYIDLYYQHRVDPNTPIEETVQAMAMLVKEGKVKFLGLSECSGETLRRAYKVHPIAAVQMEYSPWSLDIETNGLLAVAKELGVAIVAYSPLGRGFLTGKYNSIEDFEEGDFRRTNPRFQGENFKKKLQLVSGINTIAEDLDCTAGQATLAWILAQGPEFIPIPGTTNLARLEENLGASEIIMSAAQQQKIRDLIKKSIQ